MTMKSKRPVKKIERISFTQEGYNKIKEELATLRSSRKGAVETLASARALGDLSENGLYTSAKARLRSIDTEINRRVYYLKVGSVEEVSTKTVGIGNSVTVSDGNTTREFQIVGDTESDPLNGKITKKSPIGRALFGKAVKDEVVVTTPSGGKKYSIKKIS